MPIESQGNRQMKPTLPKDYGALLASIKERVRSAQYEALKSVNKELVALYWDIGRMITERQKRRGPLSLPQPPDRPPLLGQRRHQRPLC